MSEDKNLDLRANGSLILCACELREKIDNFPIDAWEPGEEVDHDALAREVIESALNIVEQIESMNRQGLA